MASINLNKKLVVWRKSLKTVLHTAFVYALLQLSEPSTARGLVSIAVLVCGYTTEPDRMDRWVLIAVTVSAFMKAVLPDRWFKLRDKVKKSLTAAADKPADPS